MTISKERLNEIALEVAKTQYEDDFHKWPDEYTKRVKDFALAFIRRVEAECDTREFYCNNGDIDRVTTLPLVSEE